MNELWLPLQLPHPSPQSKQLSLSLIFVLSFPGLMVLEDILLQVEGHYHPSFAMNAAQIDVFKLRRDVPFNTLLKTFDSRSFNPSTWTIQLNTWSKDCFGITRLVLFWYFLISIRAFVEGWTLFFILSDEALAGAEWTTFTFLINLELPLGLCLLFPILEVSPEA